MNQEYEIEIFDLNPHADFSKLRDLIKNVLNKRARSGFVILSVNEYGGGNYPKKIMYTLVRTIAIEIANNPLESPEPVTIKSKANDLNETEETEPQSMTELFRTFEERFAGPPPPRDDPDPFF